MEDRVKARDGIRRRQSSRRKPPRTMKAPCWARRERDGGSPGTAPACAMPTETSLCPPTWDATSANTKCWRRSSARRSSSRALEDWPAASLTISTTCWPSSRATAACFSRKPERSDPAYAGLVAISDAAEKGADLTHRLLAFSRREVPRPELLNLTTLIADDEEMVRRLIGDDVRLITRLEPVPEPGPRRRRSAPPGTSQPDRECARCHAPGRQPDHYYVNPRG